MLVVLWYAIITQVMLSCAILVELWLTCSNFVKQWHIVQEILVLVWQIILRRW